MNHKQSSAYLRRLTLPRKRLGWTAAGLLLGWAVTSLILSEHGFVDLWELKGQENDLRSELAGLRQQAAEVDWELAEPGGMEIERPAREKFEMQRPGEIVYHFAPVATPKNDAPESLTSTR